jgi:hypothetical protein
MCTVLLPPGDNPIAVNKYIILLLYFCLKTRRMEVVWNIFVRNIPHLILYHLFVSFTTEYAFRQVQTPSQIEFSIQFNFVLPLSSRSILSLPWSHPAAAYVFFLVFLSLLSFLQQSDFIRQFLRKTWSIHLGFLLFIFCRQFLFPWTLCNTSSFLTWSVQLMFSILLQSHTSKLLK